MIFSAKFDLKVLAPYIYGYCNSRGIGKSVIKRNCNYFCLTLESKGERTINIQFRDILNFSSPTSMDKYIQQWGSKLVKSIFPYSLYNSIEELEAATEFPDPTGFFNDLKQTSVDMELYEKAKSLYDARKKLPVDHPDRMENMKCWLRYYNQLDTEPLVQAIESSFQAFNQYFGIDPHLHHSLPSMAFDAMFSNYDSNLPYVVTFDSLNDDIRLLFRSNLIGGLTSVLHRHLDLTGCTNSPHNARFVPNGRPLTHAGSWDCNSMYLWSSNQLMPLGPGIRWNKSGRYFRKSVMHPNVSLGHMQWLYYIEATENIKLEHAFHHGEANCGGFFPDGFAIIGSVKHYFEFLGTLKYFQEIFMGCKL